jgi:hypothetical protein
MKNPTAPFETVGLRAGAGADGRRQTELRFVAPARCVGREAHSGLRPSSLTMVRHFGTRSGGASDRPVRYTRISFCRERGGPAAAIGYSSQHDRRRFPYVAPSVGRQFDYLAHSPSLTSRVSVCDKPDLNGRDSFKWSVNLG